MTTIRSRTSDEGGYRVRLWPFGRRPAAEARNNVAIPPLPFLAAPTGYAHLDGGQISVAEQAVAVRSTVQLIANICSELPFDVYSGKGSKKKEITRPSYLDDLAGDGYGTPDWIKQWVYSAAYRGNVYSNVLLRSSTGVPQQAALWHPDLVRPEDDFRGGVNWYYNGVQVPSAAFKHWRMNPVTGQLLGQSPIRAGATSIATNVAAARFGKHWFDKDAHPTGILKNTRADLKPEQSRSIRQRFSQGLRQASENGEPIVLGQSWEWQGIQVSPEEAQFLETLGASAADCARIYGPGFAEILGYPTGTPMSYANLQDRDIQLLKYGINPWLRELERVLSWFLPNPQYVIINRDALLQTNTLQRYQAHQIALGGKPWMQYGEVREIEDLPENAELEPAPAPAVPVPDPAQPQPAPEVPAP